MKRLTILFALAGLCLLGFLIAVSGVGPVVEAVRDAGWATALVVIARVVALVGDGLAWQRLFPVGQRVPVRIAVALRFVREAVNQMLPVAQVGGDFVGARLATFWRADGALAAASVVVDIAVQAGTQFLFALLGLALLVSLGASGEIVRYIGGGMVLAALGLAGFFVVQRKVGARLLSGLLRKLAGGREWMGVAAVERLWERLGDVHANRSGLVQSTLLHMAVWVFSSVEVWMALRFMGHPVSFAEAVVIESLGQAVRGAAFIVPGALGVQEGGFVAVCALFGIPAGPALALSLLKRVPDLLIGVPGLAAWQWLEGRRALGAGRPAVAVPAEGLAGGRS